MNNSNESKIDEYLKKFPTNCYWLLSFVITSLVYTLAFSVNGMLANGTHTILRGDLVHQIIPFLKSLRSVLLENHSYWFSWSNGLGWGMAGTYAYYALSPFNLLFLMFPEGYELSAVSAIIILKAATSSAIMQILLKLVSRRRSLATVIFAVLYSLCAFQVFYYFLLNFTDAIYIFPLIMIGIYMLVNEHKTCILIVAYFLAFSINFYMGYMLGICSFLLAVIYFFYVYNHKKSYFDVKTVVIKYILCVVASFLSSAIVWLPSAYQMIKFAPGDIPDTTQSITNPILIMNNVLIGEMQSLDGITPFVYCGLITAILVPLFFVNSKIDKQKRDYLLLAVVLFVLILSVEPINHVIHVFDNPQMFAYRYSYVLSFLFCIIGCLEWVHIKDITNKEWVSILLFYMTIFVCSIFIYRYQNRSNEDANSYLVAIINIIFFILYFSLINVYRLKKINALSFDLIIIMIISIELIVNVSLGMKRMEHEVHDEDMYYVCQEIDNATINEMNLENDDEFYRILPIGSRHMNYPMEYGLKGIIYFDSVEHGQVGKAMSRLGFTRLLHTILGDGATPITQMILGTKYITNIDVNKIGDNYVNIFAEEDNNEIKYYQDINGVGTLPWIENDRYLSLGFMVDDKIKQYEFKISPFENQDDLLSKMTGYNINCFEPAAVSMNSQNGGIIKYGLGDNSDYDEILRCYNSDSLYVVGHQDGKKGEDAIFTFTSDGNRKPLYYIFQIDGFSFFTDGFNETNEEPNYVYTGLECQKLYWSCIKPAGVNKQDNYEWRLILNADEEVAGFNELYACYYDDSELQKAYDILAKHQLKINDFDDGYVKGTIDVEEKGVMFTSIPYDKSWKVKVDGNMVDITPLLDAAFIGIDLEKGKHDIEMRYVATGMYAGIMLTTLGIVIILSMFFYRLKKYYK